MTDDTTKLTKLGSDTTYEYDHPSAAMLEVFDNKYPDRDYEAEYTFPEFTSLCPKTGQPDFASITITYIPDKLCVESKSLKLYFFAYRSYGSFMETITNKILDDFVKVCQPRFCVVTATFNPRGGLGIVVTASFDSTKNKK